MAYPRIPNYQQLTQRLTEYAQLKHEHGAKDLSKILARVEKCLKSALADLRKRAIDEPLAKREPNDLERIRALRPAGPRRLWPRFDKALYLEKLQGALLGRMAGCTLGAPVEFWPVEKIEALSRENQQPFPPVEYWRHVTDPFVLHYGVSARESFTLDKMDGVPVDDDLCYTLLGLLIMEEFGPDFGTEEVGRAWLKYLPYACTAEEIALANLKKGVPARACGEKDNPYCEWIGADIRSDPWGYMAPGWPERAAALGYQDAYLSHRRQGIYGEMFFSAAIAAAFGVKHPVEALQIALTEIPRDCALAKAVRWALKVAPRIANHRQARAAMEERFKGMHGVHTINNACLVVWGLTIGGTDFTRAIGETVAMGMDNDCTAATAGSIVGAVVGKQGIPAHWHEKFNDTIHSYLIGKKRFSISGVVKRFARQAFRVWSPPLKSAPRN